MYVFNILDLNVLYFLHYVTLNGFENNVIICSYIIFLIFFFIWTKYEKDNDG
jgi:hypothetical protein